MMIHDITPPQYLPKKTKKYNILKDFVGVVVGVAVLYLLFGVVYALV